MVVSANTRYIDASGLLAVQSQANSKLSPRTRVIHLRRFNARRRFSMQLVRTRWVGREIQPEAALPRLYLARLSKEGLLLNDFWNNSLV
ncbi:MAG: hypothetical protein WKH64_16920 [Chloroflexia bacterium]